MHFEFRTYSDVATQAAGCALAGVVAPDDVVLLTGDLGAGKTALTKGLATGLGVAEPVTSPTFNILLVHKGSLELNHIDLYRLEHPDQLEDIDYRGTLESGGVTVVEWGDRFVEAAPADHILVSIAIEGDADRAFRVEGHGLRGERLRADWARACETEPGVEVSG